MNWQKEPPSINSVLLRVAVALDMTPSQAKQLPRKWQRHAPTLIQVHEDEEFIALRERQQLHFLRGAQGGNDFS